VGPVEVEIFEGSKLKAGRFTVEAEVREDANGGFRAELVLTDGRRVQIGAEPLVIGRLPECGVVLADSNVSRRHAELRRNGDTVVLTDLGSTNGTRVNGAPVRERVLASGDEVSVGSTKLIFEMT
jgi:pSer/pThr/pTyr-binding forkhead associated (FHA) protein